MFDNPAQKLSLPRPPSPTNFTQATYRYNTPFAHTTTSCTLTMSAKPGLFKQESAAEHLRLCAHRIIVDCPCHPAFYWYVCHALRDATLVCFTATLEIPFPTAAGDCCAANQWLTEKKIQRTNAHAATPCLLLTHSPPSHTPEELCFTAACNPSKESHYPFMYVP